MLPNVGMLDFKQLFIYLFIFTEQLYVLFLLKAIWDQSLFIPPLKEMAKNCGDAHVNYWWKEPRNSWNRHVVCVLCSGGALGVLLQFIHTAVASQTSVLYN